LDGCEHSQNRAINTMTEINFGLRSAGNGRLARHGRSGQGSTYLRTAINSQSSSTPRHEAHTGLYFLQRLNLMDGVEHSRSPAPHAATEMNFGLHSAGRGRLARHGRPGQGSTYLRTAINSQSSSTPRHEAHTGLYFLQRLNPMDGVEHSRSPAPHAATEMNFGLHSAGRGRLARHGRPIQGSMYLRTAIYSQSSSRPQRRTVESACLGTRASTPATAHSRERLPDSAFGRTGVLVCVEGQAEGLYDQRNNDDHRRRVGADGVG